MGATDDAGPWARSLDGDGAAFAELYDRHRDRVFRHAARLVTSQHDAEDVLAAAFLELWRRRGDVRLVGGSVLPWLLVTTSNVARNVGRGTRRYRTLLDRLPRETTTADAADARWTLEATYVERTTTPLGINANGDTYGVDSPQGHPDLIAAIATNGQVGYVYATDLEEPMPANPEEAVTWNETHGGARTIPVYESDGETVVGEFVIGG